MRRILLGLLACSCAKSGSSDRPELPTFELDDEELEGVDLAGDPEAEAPDLGYVLLPLGTELFREETGSEQLGTLTHAPAGPPGAPPPVVAYRLLGQEGTRLHVQTISSPTRRCMPSQQRDSVFELQFWVEAGAAQHVLTREVDIVLPDGRVATLLRGVPVQPGEPGLFVVDASGVFDRVALPADAIGLVYHAGELRPAPAAAWVEGRTACVEPRDHVAPAPGTPHAVELRPVNSPAPGRTIVNEGVHGCPAQSLGKLSAPRKVWSGTAVFWSDSSSAGTVSGMHTFRVAPRPSPSGLLCFDREITPGVEAALCFTPHSVEPVDPQGAWPGAWVEPGFTSTTGKRKRIIRSRMPALRRCWRQSLNLTWSSGGNVAIDFVVDRDGTVGVVTARPYELDDGCAVMACFRDVFKRMKFPRAAKPWVATHEFRLVE